MEDEQPTSVGGVDVRPTLTEGSLVITDDGTHGVIVCTDPLTACWDMSTAPPASCEPRGNIPPRRFQLLRCPLGYAPKLRSVLS